MSTEMAKEHSSLEVSDVGGKEVHEENGYNGNTDEGIEMNRMSKLSGTDIDALEMRALGRTQQLNRNFRFLSTLGFACTFMSTWEVLLMTVSFALLNGGTAGLIWGYLFVWIGYTLVFASVAEMASMAPTSGGQYHWVSEFAPKSCQRFISYITGWTSVLGWQVGLASVAFLVGTMIQGLLILNNPEYVPERWHGTLIVIAVTAFCIIFNTVLAKRLPMVEGFILIVHVLGFFAILIPLWVLAPRNSAKEVFTDFLNLGGWDTTGLAFMIGLLSPVYTLIGADSAVHMSEEIKDASIVLPKAIMLASYVNGGMGFIMAITFCFCLGNVLDIIETPTGYPFIQVFFNVTQSHVGTSIMTSILIVNIISAVISIVATTSRQTWSFARDGGLPFSSVIAYVKPGWNIPVNSVILTFVITSLLSLINIGSAVAFNAIGSLCISALLSTYIISFVCIVIRRFSSTPLPARRWSLGKWGAAVNIGAIVYLLVVWVFIFFPLTKEVTPDTMNWNVVMFVGTMLFSLVYYFVYGKKTYRSPVELVKRDV